MMRDRRKFGAGRESSFLYHHARRLIGPVYVVGMGIVSFYPNFYLPEYNFGASCISIWTIHLCNGSEL